MHLLFSRRDYLPISGRPYQNSAAKDKKFGTSAPLPSIAAHFKEAPVHQTFIARL
jgi:hypothetical protein